MVPQSVSKVEAPVEAFNVRAPAPATGALVVRKGREIDRVRPALSVCQPALDGGSAFISPCHPLRDGACQIDRPRDHGWWTLTNLGWARNIALGAGTNRKLPGVGMCYPHIESFDG